MKKLILTILLTVLLSAMLSLSASAYSYANSWNNFNTYNNMNVNSYGYRDVSRNYNYDSYDSGYSTINYRPISARLYLGDYENRRYGQTTFSNNNRVSASNNYRKTYNNGYNLNYGQNYGSNFGSGYGGYSYPYFRNSYISDPFAGYYGSPYTYWFGY